MDWKDVGDWLKGNATGTAALVGNLLVGNVGGAVAAGIGLVSSATGTTDPTKAFAALQNDPATMLRLQELANASEADIRRNIERMEELRIADEAAAHSEQQETIRSGDNAEDQYVRETRPLLARQSWYGAFGFIAVAEIAKAAGYGSGASFELAALLASPALAYIGFRSIFDKGGVLGMFGRAKK